MDKPKIEKVRKALSRYGIYTEKDLDEAIKKLPPLNISCMVSPVKKVTKPEKNGGYDV